MAERDAWTRRAAWTICMAALVVVLAVGEVQAGDEGDSWARFRGPNGQGVVSGVASTPAAFTDEDVRWKTPLPGDGHSSPVVHGDKLYVTAADRDRGEQVLLRLDAGDGAIIWERRFGFAESEQHQFNSFASASPAVDAERVYVLIGSAERSRLVALDHAGEPAWERDLGRWHEEHGSGVSPIVHDGVVIVAHDHRTEDAAVFAFDAASGEPRWRLARQPGRAAYATPCVYRGADGGDQVIVASDVHGLCGIDIDSGEVVWQLEELFADRVVGSPALVEDMVVSTCGVGNSGRGLVAVSLAGAAGDASPRIAYEIERSVPYVPTPLHAEGLLFLLSDGGIVSCVDPATGEVKWRERIGGNYFASPICVNDVVYCVSRDGEVVTFRAAERFELLGRSELGAPTHATPAYTRGRLLFRTERELICIE